jgi:predicted AAA+ superfamily ATPase
MDWQTFLTARICVRYGLTKREREILQVKFPDEKTVKDNQQVAQQITNKSKDQASVDPDTVRKQLHTIYNKRFCPKENREHFPSYNDNGNKAKDEKFSAWLKQQYEYWLEEQGFKLPTNAVTAISDNPFVPLSDIIEDMSLLFGREREIRRIFETLNSGSSVALIGERRIGKSSILKAIEQQSENCLLRRRQPINLNLNLISNDEDFYHALCDRVGIKLRQV